MISRTEILEHAKLFGLRPDIIEKDYILGWLLSEINQHRSLSGSWIFKGGTCLKKCYFETYRFSEDLDFTIKNERHLDVEFLRAVFAEISTSLYQKTGIQLPLEQTTFELFTTPRGNYAVLGKVGYIGPLERRNSIPRIKIDLTHDEALILEPEKQSIHHPYSDIPESGLHAYCYAFEEVFAEKTRALAERARPRDLYDVIHLYRNQGLVSSKSLLLSTLEKKCAFKNISVPTFVDIEQHSKRQELDSEWKSMLAHQLQILPQLEQFWDELPQFFDWLYDNQKGSSLPASPTSAGETSWLPGRMGGIHHSSAYIERIQFAAANRLCVRLTYNGKVRLVEPYSFRRGQNNAIHFCGFHREAKTIKRFELNKFQGLEVTKEPFSPRYNIEINSVGHVHMPPVSTQNSERFAFGSSYQEKWIVQCPVCHKKFTRTKRDLKLNTHKGMNGYKCLGRTGILVDHR